MDSCANTAVSKRQKADKIKLKTIKFFIEITPRFDTKLSKRRGI
jgi:hypothetical protein